MGLFLLLAVTLGYCLVARRLADSVLTAPMLFLGLGVAFAALGIEVRSCRFV